MPIISLQKPQENEKDVSRRDIPSWRAGLRKVGSSSMVIDTINEVDTKNLPRSASSPRLADNNSLQNVSLRKKSGIRIEGKKYIHRDAMIHFCVFAFTACVAGVFVCENITHVLEYFDQRIFFLDYEFFPLNNVVLTFGFFQYRALFVSQIILQIYQKFFIWILLILLSNWALKYFQNSSCLSALSQS